MLSTLSISSSANLNLLFRFGLPENLSDQEQPVGKTSKLSSAIFRNLLD